MFRYSLATTIRLTITILLNRTLGQRAQFKGIVMFLILPINFWHRRQRIFSLHLNIEDVGLNFHTEHILRWTFVWQIYRWTLLVNLIFFFADLSNNNELCLVLQVIFRCSASQPWPYVWINSLHTLKPTSRSRL